MEDEEDSKGDQQDCQEEDKHNDEEDGENEEGSRLGSRLSPGSRALQVHLLAPTFFPV